MAAAEMVKGQSGADQLHVGCGDKHVVGIDVHECASVSADGPYAYDRL